MEQRCIEKVAIARKALSTLQQAIAMEVTDTIIRDGAIQRFEYCFEALWKAAQRCLREIEVIEAGSPKAVIRESFKIRLLDDSQARTALEMVKYRNLTVHTYNEALAEEIYAHLPVFANLMDAWLGSLEAYSAGETGELP